MKKRRSNRTDIQENLRIFLFCLLCFFAFHPAYAQKKNTEAPEPKKEHWIHIRSIQFSGNRITKPAVILREMSLQPGDSIKQEDLEFELNFNKKRILNLQLFSTVQYQVLNPLEDSFDVEYRVTEILYWLASPIFSLADRNINVWWFEQNHQLSRTNIGMEFTRLNFRGRNERLGGIVQVGYNKYFELFYKIPFIDKKMRSGLGMKVSYGTGREINFSTDSNKIIFFRNEVRYPYEKVDARLSYTYRKRYAITHELDLLYHYFRITPDLYLANPGFLGGKQRINYFELNYIFTYNNTDIRVYPLNGLESRTTISKKGLWIDKDVNQFSIYNETSWYTPLYRNLSSSFVFRGRLSFPQQQPYLFNRAMGFKNEYVRGYEYFVIDGSHYALLRSNLRYKLIDMVWQQNLLKFIKFIPIKVYGKVYDDIGAVYLEDPTNASRSFLNNKLLNGFGLGVDLVISYYAKFRIEYSFNHLGQNGLFLHGNKE